MLVSVWVGKRQQVLNLRRRNDTYVTIITKDEDFGGFFLGSGGICEGTDSVCQCNQPVC